MNAWLRCPLVTKTCIDLTDFVNDQAINTLKSTTSKDYKKISQRQEAKLVRTIFEIFEWPIGP